MKKLCFILLFICIILSACGKKDTKEIAYISIPMTEAQERLEKEEGYLLLDVRTKDEYENGHIPGAILLPNENIGTEEIDILPDKNQLIFVYCRSGNRSKQASEKLVNLGYTNIVEIGGINDWSGEMEKQED